MFCQNCGSAIIEGSALCENCGAPIVGSRPVAGNAPVRQEPPRLEQPEQVTPNICPYPDSFYRWVYEYSMLKNPTILFTIWKVLGTAFGAVYLFIIIITLTQTHLDRVEGILSTTKVFVILALVFAAISVVAYLTVVSQYGWKYLVLFEMNEDEVRHIQMESQFKKAQALGWLTAMAAGSYSVMGAGLLAATRDRAVSVFGNVTSVRIDRRRQVIKVNQTLDKIKSTLCRRIMIFYWNTFSTMCRPTWLARANKAGISCFTVCGGD